MGYFSYLVPPPAPKEGWTLKSWFEWQVSQGCLTAEPPREARCRSGTVARHGGPACISGPRAAQLWSATHGRPAKAPNRPG